MSNLEYLCIPPSSSIRHAVEYLDRNAKGIVLICDEQRHLIGTVTDGDIRRALLCGENLDAPVMVLMDQKKRSPHPKPATARVGSTVSELLKVMRDHVVRQVPLMDGEGRVQDLVTLDELLPDRVLPMQAVIMTGGYGTRLQPLTEHIPKPMLPVGDRPLAELIVEQLQKAGIRRVNFATHYKGEVIEKHFGDGESFGVEIRYVREDRPLGTAGALCMLEASDDPILVMNGDILTGVDFRAMLDFHNEHEAMMTVAALEHETRIPFGVVETSGISVTGILEKPVQRHLINAGIYILDAKVCRLVPEGQSYEMPELITRLVAENRRVVTFLIREYWQDIGRMEDYEKAMAHARNKVT